MSTKLENTESVPTSLSLLRQKSQALAQQVVQEIIKTYGDWELVDGHGILQRFEAGYTPSTISLGSLTNVGRQPTIHFSFTDTVTGVKWSGEMPLQLICDALEEAQKSDEN